MCDVLACHRCHGIRKEGRERELPVLKPNLEVSSIFDYRAGWLRRRSWGSLLLLSESDELGPAVQQSSASLVQARKFGDFWHRQFTCWALHLDLAGVRDGGLFVG